METYGTLELWKIHGNVWPVHTARYQNGCLEIILLPSNEGNSCIGHISRERSFGAILEAAGLCFQKLSDQKLWFLMGNTVGLGFSAARLIWKMDLTQLQLAGLPVTTILSRWWFGTSIEHFEKYIGTFIIPTDELIFFRGVAKITNQLWYLMVIHWTSHLRFHGANQPSTFILSGMGG